MFLGYQNGKIVYIAQTEEELNNLPLMKFDRIEKTNKTYKLFDGEYLTLEQIKAKEHEKIQELFMTKSVFFDGTIKAFGLDGDDLLKVIIALFEKMDYDEIQEKLAINNFKNANNFYRKHPLFDMLSDVEIPINETVKLKITSEQWDRFFDETDKGNANAYKELFPIGAI